MKREDFDYVIKQFETTGKMGFCPDTFKTFAWESVKNKNYTQTQFFDGLYETLRLINDKEGKPLIKGHITMKTNDIKKYNIN